MTQMDTKTIEDYTEQRERGMKRSGEPWLAFFHFDFPTESYCLDCLKPFMLRTTLR